MNNVIVNNDAENNGGGIYCNGKGPTITNNLIASNWGQYGAGGIYCVFTSDSEPKIVNNTIVHNMAPEHSGGGIRCIYSDPFLANNIIWGNTSPMGPQICFYEADVTISFCAIEDVDGNGVDGSWTDGGGNIGTDPLFVDAAGGDYRLTQSSPCIDAGDNTAIEGDRDLDSNDRIAGSAVDMGAYEMQE